MATGEPDKTVKLWLNRVKAAEKARDEWESRYLVTTCREYWSGIQRSDPQDQGGDARAQTNRIQPYVRQRIPSLYFYYPFARVAASPAKSDTPQETVDDKAQLLQDTANSLIRDPECRLKEQTLISLLEAHWAFGCIEVGYSADWIDNPALKSEAPPLKENERTEGVEAGAAPDPMASPMEAMPEPTEPMEQEQPDQIISKEWFWTRRIPARQMLFAVPETTHIDELDWYGYWEYVPLEDVKRAPAYKNTRELKAGGKRDEKKEGDTATSMDDVLLYKIWDARTKTKYVFAEGHDKPLLKQSFKRRCLFPLVFQAEPDKIRGIPPIYNLLGAQDEYNESREFLRIQRKTRVPRWTVDEQFIDPAEMEKFEDNEPNTWIKRKGNSTGDVISPVVQPNLSDAALQSLTLSRQEFDELAGSTGESRQTATSDTATQAAIMNQRQTVQESFDRHLVANWLSEIIRELVMLAIDKMTLDRWISINTDPYSPAFMQDAQMIAGQWQQITQQTLEEATDSLRWDINVDVDSLSPVSEQEKQAQWMNALNLISNPAVAPLLAMSPELLKRTLDLNGIKNAKDQAAIGQALMQKAQLEMQMAQAKMAGPPGVAPQPGGPGGPPPGPGGAIPQPPQLIPGPPEGSMP
jgi:hypothetical protein